MVVFIPLRTVLPGDSISIYYFWHSNIRETQYHNLKSPIVLINFTPIVNYLKPLILIHQLLCNHILGDKIVSAKPGVYIFVNINHLIFIVKDRTELTIFITALISIFLFLVIIQSIFLFAFPTTSWIYILSFHILNQQQNFEEI